MMSKNNKSLAMLLSILESKVNDDTSKYDNDNVSKEKIKLKIIEKIIGTADMNPLNNMEDAIKTMGILKECEIDAVKNDLDETTVDMIRFLKSILKEKIDSEKLDTSGTRSIHSLMDSVSDGSLEKFLSEIEEVVQEISKLNDDDIEDTKQENHFDKSKKDYEMDIAELPSNCNGSNKPSGVKLSKSMEISYEINPDRTVSLKATNLPSDISKKEFSRLLKESGLAVDKETVLREGNIFLTARVIYSGQYITLFPATTLVKFDEENKEKSCKQKFLIVEKVTKKDKMKLKIPSFLNNCNFKVKDLISKGLRKFFKEKMGLNSDINPKIISDKMAVDDEGNIFNVCVPMTR